MSQYQIAILVGSLRKDSFNRKLASAIAKLAPPEFSFKQMEIGDLPLYNQDDDAQPAASVSRLPASKQFLQNWMDQYVSWVKKHN